MNGFEEVQKYAKDFISEKEQIQQQINTIEKVREQLAGQRNKRKQIDVNDVEINEMGSRISKLGNQSQELQNQLDFKKHEAKAQVKLMINNLISENIRKIRIMNQEIQELEENDSAKNVSEIIQIKEQIEQVEEEITKLAETEREIKNGNWNFVKEDVDIEEIRIEELKVEEMQQIEEISIDEFGPIEELYIEEFSPIEEIKIEEFNEKTYKETLENFEIETLKPSKDELEELARAIVEEIVAEQTRDYNIDKIEEEEKMPDDIISFEQKEKTEDIMTTKQVENTQKSKVIIPLFGKKATISTIIVKIEDGELVYKAQMSDEQEIKIYPSRLSEENVLLRDKQNRNECKEILMNYAYSEYKAFDKRVVEKIDPLICELLIECAEQYDYDAQKLIYDYAMSFSYDSENTADSMPNIIYNLSFIEKSNLSRKEKMVINKICKKASSNNKVDIIEAFTGFKKIKYVLKRLFAVNNVKVLPEAKY